MNPQDFDALLTNRSGFFTPDQMVHSDSNNVLTQQAMQNVKATQTAAPVGNIPAPPVAPAFQRMASEQQAKSPLFFVLINNEQKGPFSLEQLKGLAMADVINETTQVWQQGTPEWMELKACLAKL